jgi:large subunit ribosomal protein L15
MKLNEIRDNQGPARARVRVGRGIGSGLGKTAGPRPEGPDQPLGVSIFGFEGGQMPLHMRLPKRGFNNIFAKDYAEVNLGAIQKALDSRQARAGGTIDHAALKAAGLARGGKDGVRLLGKGRLSAKLALRVAGASKGAREAVEKAGGTIEIIEARNSAELAAAKKGKVRETRLAAKADKVEQAGKAAKAKGREGGKPRPTRRKLVIASPGLAMPARGSCGGKFSFLGLDAFVAPLLAMTAVRPI